MLHKCHLCIYKSDRVYNLRRHYKNKHDYDLPEVSTSQLNDNRQEEPNETLEHHVTFTNADEIHKIVEGTSKLYSCKKCNKGYNTKKNYEEHEKNVIIWIYSHVLGV